MSPVRRAAVLVDGLRLGFGTFTALPTPPPRTVDTARAAVAILAAALPGAVLGAVAAVVGAGTVLLGTPVPAAAALTVGAVQLACRGFHLDGLGDTADGLAAGYDRERALTIMRKGDSGPAAVATTVLMLLTQVAALAAILERAAWPAGAAVLAAVALSRAWLVLPCLRWVPTARAQGLGAGVGRSVPALPGALSVAIVTLAAAGMLAWAGWPVWAGVAASTAAGLTAGLLVWHVVRRLGGVTGDVMGAVVEVTFTVLLLVLTLF